MTARSRAFTHCIAFSLGLFLILPMAAWSQQRVTGNNVTTVAHAAGQFRVVGPKAWIEESRDGGTFSFVEDSRSERLVNLRDPSRGVILQLDLQRMEIFYSDANNPQRPLYTITSVAA